MGFGATGPEFVLDEFVVVKFLIRQTQIVGPGLFRPAGFFIGAAFRAGLALRGISAPQLGQTSGAIINAEG